MVVPLVVPFDPSDWVGGTQGRCGALPPLPRWVYGKFGYQAMPTYEVAISPEDPAAQATHELIERDITGLPVIDEDGRVLGVVRELDLLRAIRNGGDLRQIPVGTLMDRRPLFVGPELEANHDL